MFLTASQFPTFLGRAALYQIVAPCALNILFAMCWMIGAGLWRPTLIAMFKYFTYVQMLLLAAIILFSAYYSHVEGLSSNLLTVMSLLTSLFCKCQNGKESIFFVKIYVSHFFASFLQFSR